MKKLVLIVILAFSFLPCGSSQPYPEYEQSWVITEDCYAPAKININYPYTHNHSVSDISCLGTTSLYRHSGGPENILFEAEDIDTYRYTIDIIYKEVTYVRVTTGIWSGSHPPDEAEYNFYTMHLTIDVILTVGEEPKFPTAEETAEATLDRLEKIYVEYINQLEATMKTQESTMMLVIMGLLAFGVISVAGLILSLRSRRKK